MAKINETQIKLYTGGVYSDLNNYLDRKTVKSLPFITTQTVNVIVANFTLLDNLIISGNLSVNNTSSYVTGGIICAELAGVVGAGSLASISDTSGFTLNLIDIRSATTNKSIVDSANKKVWGLLQCSNGTADGVAVGAPTFENLQISFVVFDNLDNLVLTTITDTIEFQINKLYSLRNIPILMAELGITTGGESGSGGTGLHVSDTVVNTELLSGADDDIIYVVETETFYRYESTGGAFTRDGTYILDTADAGFTRWLSIAGNYHTNNISSMGSLELKEQSSIPPPKIDTVKHFASASGGVDVNTVFLCHFDGGNGSGVFIDDSLAAHVITPNNGILQNNTQTKFGQSAGLFDGVNQFLSIGDHANWDFAGIDFTLDTWIFLGSGITKRYPIYNHKTDDDNFLAFYANTDRSLNFQYKNAGVKVIDLSGGIIDLYTWTHVVIERFGDDWTIYVNGISKATVNIALVIQDFTGNMLIGEQDLGEAVSVHGHWHLNELTGSSFMDSSGNGYNGTCVGMLDSDWVSGKLNNGLEFNPTGNYATLGAAGDFERTDAFSVEFWFKRDPADTVGYILSKMVPNIGWGVYIAAGKLTFRLFHDWSNDGWTVQADSFTLNTDWHHVIVTYDGSSNQTGVEFHVDGVKETVYSFPVSYNGGVVIGTIKNAQALQLCGRTGLTTNLGMIADEVVIYDEVIDQLYIDYRYNSGVGREEQLPELEYFDGYIDEYRITNGVARFQGNFVPSSYPYGVTSPYWILPNGSVIGLSGFGATGNKQWGEDGFDIYRDSGRVDIYDVIGAGKYDIRITNNTAGTINKYALVRATSYDSINDILNINIINATDQVMLGIVVDNILSGEQGYIRFKGSMEFGGFDTTTYSIGDPVYWDINFNTPSMNFTSYKIGTLAGALLNGVVNINFSYERKIVKNITWVTTQNVTVTTNYAILDNTIITGKIANGLLSTQVDGGIVCAPLISSIGAGNTANILDSNNSILNLVDIREKITNDPIIDGDGRKVWGLVQCATEVFSSHEAGLGIAISTDPSGLVNTTAYSFFIDNGTINQEYEFIATLGMDYDAVVSEMNTATRVGSTETVNDDNFSVLFSTNAIQIISGIAQSGLDITLSAGTTNTDVFTSLTDWVAFQNFIAGITNGGDGDNIGAPGNENVQISFIKFDVVDSMQLVALSNIIEFTVNKLYSADYFPAVMLDSGIIERDIIDANLEILNGFNTTGVQINQYTVINPAGYNIANNLPNITPIGTYTDSPLALAINNIANGDTGQLIKRGVLEVIGFNTTLASIEDIVYCDDSGILTLVETDIKIGIVLTLAINGFIYVNIGGTGGSGGGSKLVGEDEGISVITDAKTLNFIGIDVSAYQNPSDPNQLDIYIPALAFQPFYDQSNVQGNAIVGDTATINRNIANPAPENNYDIGLWTAGNPYATTRTSSLSWTHTANCSFIDNSTSTIQVTITDADDVSVLETYTTPLIVGNGVHNGINIDVTISGWAVDSIRYQGKITVDVDIDLIIPASGRWIIEIIHHNSGTDYTYTQGPLFYDTESQVAVMTGVTIAETGGSVTTRFISGIEYYDFGSQFTVNITDMDYLNNDSYPTTQAQLFGNDYPLPGLNLTGADLTGWTTWWNEVDNTYTKTDWAINQLDFFLVSTLANIYGRVVDWINGGNVNSADASVAIDTWNDLSTRLVENWRFENWRCPVGGNFDLANQKTWTSSNDVAITDAIFYNGGCERIGTLGNAGNMTIYAPNAISQPNYSVSQNATVYLYREFMHTGAASSSMRINITGSYTSIEYKLAKVWDGTPSGGTVWVDALLAYNFANWNNGNPTGGTGGQTGSGAGYIDVTFGSNNINNCSDTVYVRIGFAGANRITNLNIVFS